MTSTDERMLKHTNDLLDAVFGAVGITTKEDDMSFDSIHNAALEPPESRPCEPGEHQIDNKEFDVVTTEFIQILCEFCDATAGFKMDSKGWEL